MVTIFITNSSSILELVFKQGGIFTLSIHPMTPCLKKNQLVTAGVPLDPLPEVAISHVCSDWRRLALSMPSLWTFFHFDGTACNVVPHDKLKAYLERSQDKPFDVWLRIATDHDEREDEKHLSYKLFDQAHRLRLLRVQSDDEGVIHELTNVDEAAPMLQVLSGVPLEATVDWGTDITLEEWKPFVFRGGAPSLKYVHLDDRSLSYWTPPLTSVVHLRLECDEHTEPYLRLSVAILHSLSSRDSKPINKRTILCANHPRSWFGPSSRSSLFEALPLRQIRIRP